MVSCLRLPEKALLLQFPMVGEFIELTELSELSVLIDPNELREFTELEELMELVLPEEARPACLWYCILHIVVLFMVLALKGSENSGLSYKRELKEFIRLWMLLQAEPDLVPRNFEVLTGLQGLRSSKSLSCPSAGKLNENSVKLVAP